MFIVQHPGKKEGFTLPDDTKHGVVVDTTARSHANQLKEQGSVCEAAEKNTSTWVAYPTGRSDGQTWVP